MADMRELWGLRSILAILAVLAYGAARQLGDQFAGIGIPFSLRTPYWWLVVVIAVLGAAGLLGLILSWTAFGRVWIGTVLNWFERNHLPLGWGVLVVLIASVLLPLAALNQYEIDIQDAGFLGDKFTASWPRNLTYILAGLGVALGGKLIWKRSTWAVCLAGGMVWVALIYQLALFLQDVSTYPFSLGWSEVSRYYYASLFFSNKVYGFSISPSVLHPSRYLMQSVPFLIAELPLWVHRLWQVLLWGCTTGLTAWVLQRRLRIGDLYQRWIIAGWIFLFLLVGPVYYHLQVAALIVLWGFDRQRPWRSWIVVLLASAWAGISRVNWYPVPGMLAATLYFLEIAFEAGAVRGRAYTWQLLRYLSTPIGWTFAGSAVAFGAQAGYILLSGNQLNQFTSSFTSDLLWDRLLPSSTYPLGVLSGSLLFGLPLCVFLGWFLVRRGEWQSQFIRWLGMIGLSGILFAGGLIVSVKIGGGSNLHNMDAFLTLILVVVVYLFYDRFTQLDPHRLQPRFPVWLIALVIMLPPLFIVANGGPQHLPDREKADQVLERLAGYIEETLQDGGEILFLSQRHLVTFGMIPGVRLVPEYENVFFMEMVMAGNAEYLGQFYADLQAQRFDLIVTDILPTTIKGPEQPFSEESNLWVSRAAIPMLASYEQVDIWEDLLIELLGPMR